MESSKELRNYDIMDQSELTSGDKILSEFEKELLMEMTGRI